MKENHNKDAYIKQLENNIERLKRVNLHEKNAGWWLIKEIVDIKLYGWYFIRQSANTSIMICYKKHFLKDNPEEVIFEPNVGINHKVEEFMKHYSSVCFYGPLVCPEEVKVRLF